MKKITFFGPKLLFVGLIFSGFFAVAQTAEQAGKITASYNKSYLTDLAAKSLEKSQADKKAAIAYAKARNIPISYTTKEGAYVELQKVLPDGTLIYYTTHNANASRSTRTNHLNIGGSTGFGLDGQNMIAYVWDGGHPRVTHQEYDGPGGIDRVSVMDEASEGGTQLNFHPAHVTGTIAASGVDVNAKGMAPRSQVKAFMWNDDLSEATIAATTGMLISNHSYGYRASDLFDWELGAYIEDSYNWDNLLYNAPYFLMVNSAGNDGENNAYNGAPLSPGYDMLSAMATAKNNLTVAAANDANVGSSGNFISVTMASLSSQGPTDDLRIKPDISGNGVNLYSTYDSSDAAYGTISGTSMASPNVAGSLLLLQEHYNNLNGNFMRAATLKGLALHTTDDVAPIGPDAISGWGLLNAKQAAETISQNNFESMMQELTLGQGQTMTWTVEAAEMSKLQASISWTDPAGTINYNLNSPTPILVNDLDIRITKNTDTFFPWRLTSASSNSKDGDNFTDPYERIDVDRASGIYTVTVTHKGTLLGGSQAFSLIITGLDVECLSASIPQNASVEYIAGTKAWVTWDPISGTLYDLRYRKYNDATWTEISDIATTSYVITDLDILTAYEFQVRSKCSGGLESAYSAMVSFTTTGLEYCNSSSLYPGNNFYISNVSLNTINNNSSSSGYSDFTGIDTELTAGQTYVISIATTSVNSNYSTYYSVWIDYNYNEEFELDERIFTMNNSAANIAVGSFTVPINVDSLPTTMRVSMSNKSTPDPCDLFNNGEVEDYTIHFDVPFTTFVYENSIWTPTDPAGVSTSQDNILIINGSTNFITDITSNNLAINTGASLAVEKVLNIAGDLTNNGSLTFVSNATGNGELGTISASSNIAGNATVQRFMSSHRAYRMVSSAVTTTTSIHDHWQEGAINNTDNPAPGFGTHITGSTIDQQNGFDGTLTGNPSMFTVNVATQQFQAVPNTNTNTLAAGNPYLLFVRGDRSIDLANNSSEGETVLQANGLLYSGSQTQSFGTINAGDFAMFGNPYQSTVDINSVFVNSTNVNTNQYYIFDPNLATQGAYVTVELPAGTNTSASSTNNYLQPGQGAQVATLAAGSSSIIFSESNKAPGNFTSTNATSNSLTADNLLTVQLFTTDNLINGRPMHDSFGIIFSEDNNNNLTPVDAVKPMNFEENLGIDHNGTYLSLEKREMPQPGEAYQLYSSGFRDLNYTLKLTVQGLENSVFYLIDNFSGESTLLADGETIYSFNVSNSDPLSTSTDRFSIRNEERLGIDNSSLLSGMQLFPNPIEGSSFYIHATKLKGRNVIISIFDLLGRQMYTTKENFAENTIRINLSQDLKSGMYNVTIESNGELKNFKIIRR